MKPKQLKKHIYRAVALISTYICYTAMHASRTSWSNIEIDLAENSSISQHMSGIIDAIFLGFYCVGMFLMGWIGDQVNLRYFLFTGLLLTAIFYGVVGLMGANGYSNMFVYSIFFALNGVSQSIAWPACIASIGNWVSKGTRGLVLTVWSTCSNVGNIMGQQFGIIFGDEKNIWYKVVLISAGYVLATGILVVLVLRPYPEDVGCSIEGGKRTSIKESRLFHGAGAEPIFEQKENQDEEVVNKTEESRNDFAAVRNIESELDESRKMVSPVEPEPAKKKGVGFFEALKLPGVLMYCVIYACSKAIAYGIMYGFKTQVEQNIVHDPVIATKITQYGDLAQLVGGILFGGLTDVLQSRALAAPIMFAIAGGFMFMMTVVQSSITAFTWMFILFSFFFGGPYLVIGTAIATDLAKNKAIAGNERALSTISGTIDASGSFGAMVMSILVPQLSVNQVFYCFTAFTIIVGCMFITPAYRDWLDIKQRKIRADLEKKLLAPQDD